MKEKFDLKIKEISSWLSDWVRTTTSEVQSKNITLEGFLTILIKIFIVVVLLAILKWPFMIIGSIGKFTFMSPFMITGVWYWLWVALLEVLYIILSVMTILFVFKDELLVNNKTLATKKASTKSKTTKTLKSEDNPINIALIILKIIIVITVVIPLIIMISGLVVVIASIIYLIIKGVMLYGLLMLMIGLVGIVGYVIELVINLMKGRKLRVWSFIIPVILFLAGIFASLDWLLGIDIKYGAKENTDQRVIIVDKEDYNRNNDHYVDTKYVEDNTLPTNQVKVIIEYNEKYNDIIEIDKNGNVDIDFEDTYHFKKYSDKFINNLKNDILYIPYISMEVHASDKIINDLK